MSRRRIINGHVFIQIRSGAWREVKDGYIRTRRGWRKLQQRSGRSRQPVAPPVSRRQWLGKYDVLRLEARG